jgi:hypothetical protein
MRMKQRLLALLKKGWTLEEAEQKYNYALISESEWTLYCILWHWCCVRFSSGKQISYEKKFGLDRLIARLDRFREKLTS